MGKVLGSVVVAFGVGTFLTTVLAPLLGAQTEIAAVGLSGVALLGASQFLGWRAAPSPQEDSLKGTLGRAKVPA